MRTYQLVILVLTLVSDYNTLAQLSIPSRPRSGHSPFRDALSARQVLRNSSPTTFSQCKLTGPIETTQCDYETLEAVNANLHEKLHSLSRTPFFKYLKIDLGRQCPFWESNGFCSMRDCAVSTVDEGDIPEYWRTESLSRLNRPPVKELYNSFPGCYCRDSDFCVLDDEEAKGGEYVDLTLNPERFTGYSGPAAHRIWSAIYNENCFGLVEDDFMTGKQYNDIDPDLLTTSQLGISPAGFIPLAHQAHKREQDTCLEKRVYYRVISGLHASISMHLCAHSLDQKTGQWAPSLQCFIDRVGSYPDRLQYIYFNAVILLRALSRAGKYLAAYDMYTGVGMDGEVDRLTTALMGDVITIANTAGQFNESMLFRGDDSKTLKDEFKVHFRNVTRIMDCVGCDKCRLWGKVQTSGLGTALKILFELDEAAFDPVLNPGLLLRSEVVTLINTLHQFSETLLAVEDFRRMWAEAEGISSATNSAANSEDPITPRKPHLSTSLDNGSDGKGLGSVADLLQYAGATVESPGAAMRNLMPNMDKVAKPTQAARRNSEL